MKSKKEVILQHKDSMILKKTPTRIICESVAVYFLRVTLEIRNTNLKLTVCCSRKLNY